MMLPKVPPFFSHTDMPHTSAFKRFLTIFFPNQNLDRVRMNICASTACFQDFPDGEQGKGNLGAAYLRE